MWLSVIFLFVFSSLLSLFATATEICAPKACSRNSDNEKAVCASDGMTYPNRCVFETIRCQNRNLTLVRRGPCKQNRPCSDIKPAITNASFTPKCRPDGTFDSEQCHLSTLHCWCVTPEGIPLPYTVWARNSKDEQSKCDRKKVPRMRFSTRNNLKGRTCKTADKAQLNNNLINSFHSEYSRESGRNHTDAEIVRWKFNVLDQNHNFALEKTEYKDLKKVVKKVMKPKKCAKQFPRNCDMNRDGLISMQEWDECLNRDGLDALPQNNKDNENHQKDFDKLAPHLDLHGFQNLTKQNCSNNQRDNCEEGDEPIMKVKQDISGSQPHSSSNDNDDNPDDYDDVLGVGKSPPHGVLHAGMDPVGSYDSESVEASDDPTDCISDRKNALSDGDELYVPECTPDGRYQKVQCYKSAGYCWCVNEDTGKNIPGTSVKNGTPKCDHAKTITRIMKGCPETKKLAFLRDLLEYFHSEMTKKLNANPSRNKFVWMDSKEEQAATLHFLVLDTNKNQVLERAEWKAFKSEMEKIKKLKKCGKKLPRYCDSNKDMRITMTEWLDCLNIQQGDMPINPTPSSRMGKNNPLSMLKDD